MGNAIDNDRNDENTLTSSDLRGLLKAASLTEFKLDSLSDNEEDKFVKSNSLFDLVRSKLLDEEIGDEAKTSEAPSDDESLESDQIDQENSSGSSDVKQPASNDPNILESPDSISETEGERLRATEDSSEISKIDDVDLEIKTTDSVSKDNFAQPSDDTFERSAIVDDIKEVASQKIEIKESDEFLKEIENLNLDFNSRLEKERYSFEKTLEILFGASNFIKGEIESQISELVLNVASDLAGTKIDELPAPFFEKIARVAKQIVGNETDVTIYLSAEDFKVIDSLKNDTDFIYNFGEKETLKRGEFEVLSRKSTAKISLFDMTEEG